MIAGTYNFRHLNANSDATLNSLDITTDLDVGGDLDVVGQIMADDGTAGAPGYSFSSNSSSGMRLQSVNNLKLVTGGANRLGISSASILATVPLLLNSIKSGATQGAAGAAVDEVWKTASHATLPDNVLLIGV